MCGILLVKSNQELPVELHLRALSTLKSRGPDHTRYQYENGIFIAQAVLHITGSDDYYKQTHTNFLAYNGEIYNYKELGNYSNDIEFVDECVNSNARWPADGVLGHGHGLTVVLYVMPDLKAKKHCFNIKMKIF